MNNEQRRSRLIIAGTGSGSGKTTVTLGLMRAFAKRGLQVQGFKCGPDYIDPAYHAAATGRTSYNLDSWMTDIPYMQMSFLRHSESADISIIEGVMGLYDGKEAEGLLGSTAEIAIATGSPVLLVVDVRSMGRSAAAIVLGFQQLEPGVHIAAVFVNRCGSSSHYKTVKQAIESACGVPVIGWLRRESELNIPERHLGLLPAVERGELEPLFELAAERLAEGTDLELLLEIARSAPAMKSPYAGVDFGPGTKEVPSEQLPLSPPALNAPAILAPDIAAAPVIAVARDAAFNFYYEDNLEQLVRAGARIIEFSPLNGDGVPEETDGLYLGGGFPEEFAATLSENTVFMQGLQTAADKGMPIYAECGGYMVLARTLTDRNGLTYNMAGLIPAHAVMQQRRAALGYREVTAMEDCLLLRKGERLRGHEFHYSVMHYEEKLPRSFAYISQGRSGKEPEGYMQGQLLGAYFHAHLASHAPSAYRFVEACRLYRNGRAI
ncbi:cobyrinate a,c-diamide synthase [Paenibacillus sp. sgz500958]|uniref:cobyrinate a,c-diamide synthase n=1 Tax=Paenibacillus sp. sgz500958 TaxID=3242475 RepID=UPI0036D3F3FC